MILLTFNIALSDQLFKAREKDHEQQLAALENKAESIMLLLELHEYKATFFIEAGIAEQLQKLIRNMAFAGHEIALYNVNSDIVRIENTKKNLEQLLEKPIRGMRQKLRRLTYPEIKNLEFSYVSNIESSKINFLWRKLTTKTDIYEQDDLTIIPESQSPYSQLPFNDYVLQMTPMKYYENMLLESLKNNEYVMIYANSWQFFANDESPFELPFYKRMNTGRKFEDRLEQLLQFIDENELAVSRMKDYLF